MGLTMTLANNISFAKSYPTDSIILKSKIRETLATSILIANSLKMHRGSTKNYLKQKNSVKMTNISTTYHGATLKQDHLKRPLMDSPIFLIGIVATIKMIAFLDWP
jgi:hypothetical protein